MHLLDLELIQENLLLDKFRSLNMEISEYSFANIYLFRREHHYQLYFDKELFVKGITRDGHSYLMPTFPLENASQEDLIKWLNEVDFFFPIPELWLSHFDKKYFQFSCSDSDADYLFDHERMSLLGGRDLSKKRNLIKQLLDEHQVTSFTLDADRVKDGLIILDKWQENQELDKTKTDYYPCLEALNLLSPLQLSGRIYYVDGNPAGLIIGEILTGNQYAIHFAKADKTIKGLYQYILQESAKGLDQKIKYINLEQDIGLPQVQQTKHSYHPDKMIKKWRVALK